MMNIAYFYVNFFRYYKRFLPSWPCRHFLKYFYPISSNTQIFISSWYNYANKINCNFTKKACNFIIKRLKHNKCSWSLKKTERIKQNTIDRTCFLNNHLEQVNWVPFSLKLMTITRVMNMKLFIIPEEQQLWPSPFLEIIYIATTIGAHQRLPCGDNCIS